MRKLKPLLANHAAVTEPLICPACHKPFVEGDVTTLIELGPGDDSWEQQKCQAGKPYNAVASLVHWACAGGVK